MTKVIVAGAAGRMGQRISYMVQQNPDLTLAAAFEQPESPAIGKDVGENAGFGATGVKISAGLASVIVQGEVSSDFSFHKATMQFVKIAAAHGRAMVIGTTGLSAEELATLKEAADSNFPCVQAPNMAVGGYVLF